jgi:glycosyltransferase 2 family protein
MKTDWKRLLRRGAELLVAGLILFFVGWQFKNDLEPKDDPDRPNITDIELRPAWLAASGALYLVSVFPTAWYWRRLHANFGYPLPLYAALRAHYISQLGKYVPGKALALLMRAKFTRPFGVPYGVSVIISFYEVLTGMAAGGILAALVYAIEPPRGDLEVGLHPLAIGAILIGMCGIPLLPGVFNFVVAKMSARIQAVQLYRLPPLRFGVLATGLLTTGVGWWVQGLSWWAMLNAVLPEPPGLTFSLWAQCTASIAFATVAGFVLVFIPGGLGVRELILSRLLLGIVGAPAYISAAAILLRLDWIASEALVALCVYWLKPRERIAD